MAWVPNHEVSMRFIRIYFWCGVWALCMTIMVPFVLLARLFEEIGFPWFGYALVVLMPVSWLASYAYGKMERAS